MLNSACEVESTANSSDAALPRTALPRLGGTWGPLVDGFGRVHTDLRVSVTDRCNLRCTYCMPAEQVEFKPRSELLTFEEIERFVRVAARLGVNKLRLTGGDPLVRRELHVLVAKLAAIPGLADIALSTNGLLLAEQAQALKDAGLHRLNVSLDALDPEAFQQIARRDGLQRVLNGIFTAQQVGFDRIKLNAVAIRGITERQVVPLSRFAREHRLELRFIEFMPLDADAAWSNGQVLSGDEIRAQIEREVGPLECTTGGDPSQPATDYRFVDGGGSIGFINTVTQPFCDACNRLRLTAEGQIRNCLFSIEEWDARGLMRGGGSDEQLARLISSSVGAKKASHGINTADFHRPARAMFQIGG
jgi:cyclic pyranopterin phosphate synthase